MPEVSLLGWFHTVIAITGILSGLYSLAKYEVIELEPLSVRILEIFLYGFFHFLPYWSEHANVLDPKKVNTL